MGKPEIKIIIKDEIGSFPFPRNMPIPKVGEYIGLYNAYEKCLKVINIYHYYYVRGTGTNAITIQCELK